MAFKFKVECVSSGPYVIRANSAIIPIRFHHYNTSSIEIGVFGESGALNLGFRLLLKEVPSPVFEDRVKTFGRVIEFGETANLNIVIPKSVIDMSCSYILNIDLVYEDNYWFNDKISSAVEIPVSFIDGATAHIDQIETIQTSSLHKYIAIAYSRIAELEYVEKTLHSEKEYYRERFNALSRSTKNILESGAALPPPAAKLDQALELVDIVTRRDCWLDVLSKAGLSGHAFSLYPHDGKLGKRQILIYGSGGYGDMVYLSTIIREIHDFFAPCIVVVLHENKNVGEVFDGNPYVSASMYLNNENWKTFIEAAHCFDVFDMLVDVRYVVTYIFPPLSRIPLDFRLRAQYSGAEYQKYIRFAAWPKLNNLLANLVMSRGMSKLDLIGQTSLLPIDKYSDLDIFIPESELPDWDDLAGQPFITVHHGADKNMASSERALQTKNCSLSFWREFVALAKSDGFKIVQLGQKGEALIAGVDYDLRGKTSLTQTAAIIKFASVHVDTEGGLVHLARAVQNRSVVLFGPTPVGFFGYPQNINIGPKACGNCWWSTSDWSMACPRDLNEPECMSGHVPAEALAASKQIAAAPRHVFSLVKCVPQSGEVKLAEDLQLREYLVGLDADAGVVIGPACPLEAALELLAALKMATKIFIDAARFARAAMQFGQQLSLRAYSQGNFPIPDNSLSGLVALDLDIRNVKGAILCADMARSVRRDGVLVIRAANGSELLSGAAWIEHFVRASLRIPGSRLSRLLSMPTYSDSSQTTVLYLVLAAQRALSIEAPALAATQEEAVGAAV